MPARVWYQINSDDWRLAMWDDMGSGERAFYIAPNEWHITPKGHVIPEGAIHDLHDAQGLLDALLAAGVRPSSNAWSAGHVADLKEHIRFAEQVAARLLPSMPK